MAYLLGFNNNIRCIEIYLRLVDLFVRPGFNNNIRCIEMFDTVYLTVLPKRLITT